MMTMRSCSQKIRAREKESGKRDEERRKRQSLALKEKRMGGDIGTEKNNKGGGVGPPYDAERKGERESKTTTVEKREQ